MSMSDFFALIASCVSAVGGGFAARAAFLSARSARIAQESAERAEHRNSLKELAVAAGSIVVEDRRIQARASELKLAHIGLATLCGAASGSRQSLHINAIEEKAQESLRYATDAQLFADGAKSLVQAPVEEMDRVQLRLAKHLAIARGLREDLEEELRSVNAQCAEQRESRDRTRLAR